MLLVYTLVIFKLQGYFVFQTKSQIIVLHLVALLEPEDGLASQKHLRLQVIIVKVTQLLHF